MLLPLGLMCPSWLIDSRLYIQPPNRLLLNLGLAVPDTDMSGCLSGGPRPDCLEGQSLNVGKLFDLNSIPETGVRLEITVVCFRVSQTGTLFALGWHG
ncbi:unnamed protein product [Protopolystoma xenopodis]|uniref:Uncharacterized protein n=1 Tax=Protopolystoma xenopodis TaxID=117903 RepID=A0A448WY25_9PLAT|nr:unnamed protein product [Protopolystoma xenopodis]